MNKFFKTILKGALALALSTAFMAVMIPLVLDAIETENQWRADRLCKQGYTCHE